MSSLLNNSQRRSAHVARATAARGPRADEANVGERGRARLVADLPSYETSQGHSREISRSHNARVFSFVLLDCLFGSAFLSLYRGTRRLCARPWPPAIVRLVDFPAHLAFLKRATPSPLFVLSIRAETRKVGIRPTFSCDVAPPPACR